MKSPNLLPSASMVVFYVSVGQWWCQRKLKKLKPVTICKHGGPPSKDRPPEAKAAIVVDRVVGLQLVVIDDFEQADDDT